MHYCLKISNGYFCNLSACSLMNWPLPVLKSHRSLRSLSYSTYSTLKLMSARLVASLLTLVESVISLQDCNTSTVYLHCGV